MYRNEIIMKDYPIFQIDDILVSSEILTEFFACDYEKCKGACCIIGDSGAPMEEGEAEEIEKNYHHFSHLLTEEEQEVIDRDGFFVIDSDGDMVTPLVRDSQECVYTWFDDNDSCFCAIERCYCKGKGSFKKPISCSLYPIRASKLSNGMTALNLHRWDLCKDAFAKGKKEGIHVYKFLRDPLITAYGEEFYSALEAAASSLK